MKCCPYHSGETRSLFSSAKVTFVLQTLPHKHSEITSESGRMEAGVMSNDAFDDLILNTMLLSPATNLKLLTVPIPKSIT